MNKREALKIIRRTEDTCMREIERNTDRSSKFSRGLAVEGYMGGYMQALSDVALLLHSGCMPNTRNLWNRDDTDH